MSAEDARQLANAAEAQVQQLEAQLAQARDAMATAGKRQQAAHDRLGTAQQRLQSARSRRREVQRNAQDAQEKLSLAEHSQVPQSGGWQWISQFGRFVTGLFGATGASEITVEVELSSLDELRRRLRTSAEETQELLSTADQDLQAAEREQFAAQTTLAELGAAVAAARREAERLEGSMQGARQRAEQARLEAERLAASAATARRRRQIHLSLRDQHVPWLSTASGRARGQHRRARERFQAASFIEPKSGEASQDAVATAPELGRFAIADGVTNSDFSGEFARAVVQLWTRKPLARPEELGSWLAPAQQAWEAEVAPLIAAKRNAWYNRGRRWLGHTTFVGARLENAGTGQRLHLVGIGDTVAFLVRDGALTRSFPLQRSGEFSDEVQALPSAGDPPFAPVTEAWEVRPGDEIFLATDALAAWILAEVESGSSPFPTLRAIRTRQQMQSFVTAARAGTLAGHGAMREDDTSLLRFVVPAPE
jgi:hypothetical protein